MKYLLPLLFVACSCKEGPRVDICLVDSTRNQMACSDRKKNPYVLPIKDADNMVCTYPEDLKTLLEYCKIRRENN